MTLGEKIKLLRIQQELTQPELADKAGIEQSYLSKLENDKGTPSFDIINRIAKALGLTGMELINSLSQSYIEEHLSHIPEVAAEYASIRLKRENTMKRRYFYGALLIVLGIALFMGGSHEVHFSSRYFSYESEGVIREGENILQFWAGPIKEMGETFEDFQERLRANASRLDWDIVTTDKYLGEAYIAQVDGGRRYYHLSDERGVKRKENMFLVSLGVSFFSAGILLLLFNFVFRSKV